jgi:hypothetical protein
MKWIVLAALLVGAPVSWAQSSIAEVLPDDTLAVLMLDDVAQLRENYAENILGRLFADPEFEAIRDELSALLTQLGDQSVEKTGVDVVELLGMISGSAGVALVAFETPPDAQPLFSLALLLDAGDDAQEFADGIDRLVDILLEEDTGVVLKSESVGDVDCAVLLFEDEDSPEIRYGLSESTLIVTVANPELERDDFADIVDGLSGELEVSLADAPRFAGSLASAPGSDLTMWLDVGGFVKRLLVVAEASGGSPLSSEAAEDMGLLALGSLSVTGDISADETRGAMELGFLGRGQIQQVLLAGLGGQSPTMPQWIPADVNGSYSLDLDLAGMFDAFIGMTMKEDPEAAREIIDGMAEVEEDIGFNPRDDLLENLDGQIGFFATEVGADEQLLFLPSDPPVNFALMLGLDDGESMTALLDAAIRAQGLHAARHREQFEGFVIYHVPVFPGVGLAYSVVDDMLVLSLAPSLVKDVLRRKGNAELPTLASMPAAVERLSDFPEARTVVIYEQASGQIKALLGALVQLEQQFGLGAFAPLPPPQDDGANPFEDLLSAIRDVDLDFVDKYYDSAVTVTSVTLNEGGLSMLSSGP